MNKKVLGMVLSIIVGILVVGGISYRFISRDTCRIDEKIKYSYFDYYVRNNEKDKGMFMTLGIDEDYIIIDNYGEYKEYYDFLKERVRLLETKLYDEYFFQENNLW